MRVLRERLRRLGRELGRDAEHQEFWFARLADAVHELLRERTEQELPDLCGTRPRPGPAIQRLRRVLERFTSLGGERSFAPGSAPGTASAGPCAGCAACPASRRPAHAPCSPPGGCCSRATRASR
ncbi:MAG: hypothetical protein R3F30_02175 [Planctomycetota bacterium]